jgi:hypothetical protein
MQQTLMSFVYPQRFYTSTGANGPTLWTTHGMSAYSRFNEYVQKKVVNYWILQAFNIRKSEGILLYKKYVAGW